MPLWCSERRPVPRPLRGKQKRRGLRGWDGPLRAGRGGPERGAGLRAGLRRVSPLSQPREMVRSGRAALNGSQAGRQSWGIRAALPRALLAPAPRGRSTAAPAAAMLGLLMAVLALALAYFALLDGWYLVRVPCAVLRARLLQPRVRDLLAEQSYSGRVLPSDLDLLLHMNNARYLREADVARAAHLARCGVLGALRALGARAVLAASCARYRRSLRLLEPFEVRTRLLGWDDRAFYLEARFISLRDGFVCALLRSRQHVLGTSPERVVQHLCKRRVSVPRPERTPPAGP